MGRTRRYTESSPFTMRLVIKEIVTEIGDNAFEDFEVSVLPKEQELIPEY